MAFILFMVAGRWVGRFGVSEVTKHFVLFDTGSARPSVVGTGPDGADGLAFLTLETIMKTAMADM